MANPYMQMSVAPKKATGTIIDTQKQKSQKEQQKSGRVDNYMVMSTTGKKSPAPKGSAIAADNPLPSSTKEKRSAKSQGREKSEQKSHGREKSNPKSRGREIGGDNREKRRKSPAGSGKEKKKGKPAPVNKRGAKSSTSQDGSASSSGRPSSLHIRKNAGCCSSKLCVVLLLVGLLIAGIAGFLVYYFVIGPSLQASTTKDVMEITTTSGLDTLSPDDETTTELISSVELTTTESSTTSTPPTTEISTTPSTTETSTSTISSTDSSSSPAESTTETSAPVL